MRVHRLLAALLATSLLAAQAPHKIETADFLRHAKTWQLPEYPRLSASERHSGEVGATVDVNLKGDVSNVAILYAPDVHMAETVKSVVSQWTFRPFLEADKTVKVESTIYILFRLQPDGPNVIIPGLTKEPEPTVKDPFRRIDK
jgi:TonB family protein